MDELISKLRSQSTQKQTSRIASQDSLNDVEGCTEKDAQAVAEAFEITTSQSENIQQSRFKLDFDCLKRQRIGSFLTVSEVKTSDLWKITVPLWVIVKSVEVFKGHRSSVYRWEVCDETGSIYGSSIVEDTKVKVGNIVCLYDFSLWKIEGNHLNIVERNIKKIID